jgi:hypothetical protein
MLKKENEEMVKSKYGKYILRGIKEAKPRAKKSAVTPVTLEGLKNWGGIQLRMKWRYISKPIVLVEESHTHDFDEFLVFLGSDPTSEQDFGAEIELSLGKEGEKQIINTPTVICIPKGLVHCPINFKKVDKTVLFSNIYTAPEYVRKPVKK